MNYQEFKQEIQRRYDQATAPRIPFGEPGSIHSWPKDRANEVIYEKLLFELVDDPRQSVKNVERLLAEQNDSECRQFYTERLEELRIVLLENENV